MSVTDRETLDAFHDDRLRYSGTLIDVRIRRAMKSVVSKLESFRKGTNVGYREDHMYLLGLIDDLQKRVISLESTPSTTKRRGGKGVADIYQRDLPAGFCLVSKALMEAGIPVHNISILGSANVVEGITRLYPGRGTQANPWIAPSVAISKFIANAKKSA